MTNWPKIKGFEIDQIGGNWETVAELTLRQVEKDFGMQGIPLLLDSQNNYESILENLADKMRAINLLEHPNLAGLLYQLDVNQSKIAQILHASEPSKVYVHLAEGVLKRCFEKVCWRLKLKQ